MVLLLRHRLDASRTDGAGARDAVRSCFKNPGDAHAFQAVFGGERGAACEETVGAGSDVAAALTAASASATLLCIMFAV